jgi:WD40 repeat protein
VTVLPDFYGRYIVIYGTSTVIYVYEIETKILSRYDGQAALVSFVAPPTKDSDRIMVGDVNGTVRVWDPPRHSARIVARTSTPLYTVSFATNETILTGGADGIVRQIDITNNAVAGFKGHTDVVTRIHPSPDGRSFLSFGHDRTVHVWQPGSETPIRIFKEHASTVEDADYIENGRRIVSVGDDGRLFAWSPDQTDTTLLFSHPTPLVALEVLVHNDHIVIEDNGGALWDIAPTGALRAITTGGGTTVVLRASPDGRMLATGSDEGTVTVYNTLDWTVVKTLTVGGRVCQIQFDPLNRELLVASEDGRVQQLPLQPSTRLPWRDMPADVRDVAYSPDGNTIGCRSAHVTLP